MTAREILEKHGNVLKGIAYSAVPQLMSMAKFAARVEENETLIRMHRGQKRLDDLRWIGLTTRCGYSDIIQEEADQIRRELMFRTLFPETKPVHSEEIKDTSASG